MPRLSKIGAAALAAFGWTAGGATTVSASYLVIGGGGGGGGNCGGGGGAGGYQSGTSTLNTTLSYTVTVGAGGFNQVGNTNTTGGNGNPSSLGSIATATGGGGGGGWTQNGAAGASGGGAGNSYTGTTTGGAGTSGQGNNGGTSTGGGSQPYVGAGGGGAGAVGGNASGAGGVGGVGTPNSISGTSTYYSGGGGGGIYSSGTLAGGAGGNGGGGAGGGTTSGVAYSGTPGTANTGGGGGGSGGSAPFSGIGGSGVVIISYAGAQQFSGGVVTSVGGNTIHTFTTSGTLGPITTLSASYLIVAGGGGAGDNRGGGAGGGGLLSGSGLTIDPNSTYLVTVGAGGAGGAGNVPPTSAQDGSGSSFLAYSATGGGGGGGAALAGRNGGSGGGGGASSSAGGAGGTGNTPSTSPSQGTNGGAGIGYSGGSFGAGGGGGGGGSSGVAGSSASGTTAGNGGNGTSSSISGTSTFYAGGGGGGGGNAANSSGGSGGGGAGAYGAGLPATQVAGTNGTANTGGGAGGGSNYATTAVTQASGGSGVVIISYAGTTQQMAGGTVTIVGGNVIHTFTSTGYLSPIKYSTGSLRFRQNGNNAYLSRTPTVAGNRQTWTWSGWVKRGILTTENEVFGSRPSAGTYTQFSFRNSGSGAPYCFLIEDNTYGNMLVTTQVFRDPAAWYHIVVVLDTTQATSSNRLKLYVNGAQVTSFSSTSYPAQNASLQINNTAIHNIAADNYDSANRFDGEMTEINFVDGQALTPNSFGTFNSYGVWQPITYGGSYGTNGFYLPFNRQAVSYVGSFNGSNQYLQTTLPATLSGQFTIEAYVYRNSAINGAVFTLGDSITSTGLEVYIGSSGTLYQAYSNNAAQISTTSPIPTVGGWSHVAITRDSSNVVRLFMNGIQVGGTWTTTAAFSNTLRISAEFYSGVLNSNYWNGYISNFRVVTGTALYTSNFIPSTSALTAVSGTQLLTLQNSSIVDNSTNALSITNNNGVSTGQTYPFSYGIFNDQGPAGNNWTPSGISGAFGSTLDYLGDAPTLTSATVANYATWNPLKSDSSTSTYQNGNLQVTFPSGAAGGIATATMAVSSGKFYWEITVVGTDGNTQPKIGVISPTVNTQTSASIDIASYGYSYSRNGQKSILGTVSAYGASFTTGDVIGFALDMDAGTLVCYKNNSSQGTLVTGLSGLLQPGITAYNGYTETANFGQQPFVYTPPSGFVGLNTFNL